MVTMAKRVYANPFHETLADYVEQAEQGEQRAQLAELDHKIHRNNRLAGIKPGTYPKGMTRQQAFVAGYIPVQDLDDEELRVGRCRAANGKIPRVGSRTEVMPQQLYDSMIQEHFKRSNEKLRSQLDVALATMVDIMQDDTCEPKDRMDAAKYLYERVAGKTPERVQVAVTREPWEEVLGGIAQISRAESRAMRNGHNVVDAEVVEAEPFTPRNPDGYAAPSSDRPSGDPEASEAPRQAEPSEPDSAAAGGREDGPRRPYFDLAGDPLVGDHRITHPTYMPGHEQPQNTSATAPLVANTGRANSEVLRDEVDAAKELAARRKAARKRIQDAKKRRAIARATGQDAKGNSTIELTESEGKIQFRVDG